MRLKRSASITQLDFLTGEKRRHVSVRCKKKKIMKCRHAKNKDCKTLVYTQHATCKDVPQFYWLPRRSEMNKVTVTYDIFSNKQDEVYVDVPNINFAIPLLLAHSTNTDSGIDELELVSPSQRVLWRFGTDLQLLPRGLPREGFIT